MGTVIAEIDDALSTWLTSRPVFFVATAPLSGEGLLNCSPKGMAGSFVVLDGTTVAYLDLTGSGIETVAHLRENGRIVLMFCAFEGRPRIVRLHGRGHVVVSGDPRFGDLAQRFPAHPGIRSVVVIEVDRIAESCGYGVPQLEYVADRPVLDQWALKKGEAALADYRAAKNAVSLDGLPGIPDQHDSSL